MLIGVPKEIMLNEGRVGLTPEIVKEIVENGISVLVEKNAGINCFYKDEDYVAAGAKMVEDVEELYRQADVVIKVKEPRINEEKGKHEIEMMREGACLICFLHPGNPANAEVNQLLAKRNILSFTLDGVPRITRAQPMDALTSMSTVTGYKSVVIAANVFPKLIPTVAIAVGVTRPAKVLVVGAGIVGLQAIATAKRLGAEVEALDIRKDAREQAASLGAKVVGFEVPEDIALAEGGYAKRLPEEWYKKEREAIKEHVSGADIVILSALILGEEAPILVTEDMVKSMKPGSVIVDVSIDQGGCCELTSAGEEVVRHGVHIFGIKNIPGSVPVHASWMFANNVYSFLRYITKDGKITVDLDDEIVRSTIVTYQGKVVHTGTLKVVQAS